jgi:hypothetical protein
MAQKQFSRQGFQLYDSDEEVHALLRSAGFGGAVQRVNGSPERPEGRLALAAAGLPVEDGTPSS